MKTSKLPSGDFGDLAFALLLCVGVPLICVNGLVLLVLLVTGAWR